jgi:hypothetical protein
VLYDDGKHPHLVNVHQMRWTLRSIAINFLLVVGDDGHKLK